VRILITGASGQIGTNLALRCLAEGHSVYGLDLRPNPWTSEIPQSLVDLTRPNTATTLSSGLAPFGKPEVVVHLAGHAKVHQLMLQPDKAVDNIVMTQQVLEYCRRQIIPIVFASSREVYGDQPRARMGEEDADFTLAVSTYAAAKLSCEALIHGYARGYGLQYLVFRLSNVYGRYDNDLHRMGRVIPLFMDKLWRGEAVTLFGPDKILDFTHVDDCVDGIVRGIQALVTGKVVNETINLARGEGHTLRQLCQFVSQALCVPVTIQEAPPRDGEITRYVARLDKARRLLGYDPKISLPDGLARARDWAITSRRPVVSPVHNASASLS
jgi:UDP-glucose 4-epimerase